MTQLVPMSIKGLMLDPVSNSPIVVLKDEQEKFFLSFNPGGYLRRDSRLAPPNFVVQWMWVSSS